MRVISIVFAICFPFLTWGQGKLGIGTSSPSEKLDVSGNIKADSIKANSIKINNNAGNGKVLTSDANGNGIWQTPTSGGTIKTYNGLSKSNDTIRLGGRLNTATGIGLFGNELAIGDLAASLSTLTQNSSGGSSTSLNPSTAITQTFTTIRNAEVVTIAVDVTMLAGSSCTLNVIDENNAVIASANQSFGALYNGLNPFAVNCEIEKNKQYTLSITGTPNGFVNYGNGDPYLSGSSSIPGADLVFLVYGYSEEALLALKSGYVGIGTATPTAKLEINGKTLSDSLEVNTFSSFNGQIKIGGNLAISGGTPGLGKVLTSDATGNATWENNIFVETDPQVGTISNNYFPKWTNASGSLVNSIMQENTSGNIGINASPLIQYRMYVYHQQLTINGDGQTTLMGYRTRDSQNDGTGYGQSFANDATRGYNFWGDLYTFGVGGWNYNDYTRCGGTFGSEVSGTYWGSLGYRSSALLNYGVYGSTAYATGGGYLPNTETTTNIGGGFFGHVGSVSKGSIVGQITEGELFASYNKGDVYTSGKQVELVKTNAEGKVIPAYALTSNELKVYACGKITLINGQATVQFDDSYVSLLNEAPIVTVSPMGSCNGVYISKVDKSSFTLIEQNKGNSNVEISWIAVGTRIDAAANAVPEMLLENDFDASLSKTLFNDADTKHSGQGMWWNGSRLMFGEIPAYLHLTREQKTKLMERNETQTLQEKKD